MQRFKNILVYIPAHSLQQPNPAVEYAASIAERNNAVVKLLCIHDSFWWPEDDEALDRLAADLRERGVRVTTDHPWGLPTEEILNEVRCGGYDLVMKTACPDDQSPMSFGATGIQLMRRAPCPVWIIQPEQDRPFSRILAAIGPSGREQAEDDLNHRILEAATSLARLQDAHLDVVHAWSVNAERKRDAANESLQFGAIESALQKRLHKAVSSFPTLCRDRVHLIHGNPMSIIPGFASEHRSDIIVMGATQRSGIARFVYRNTAERMLRQVSCSVLTLKPQQSLLRAHHAWSSDHNVDVEVAHGV